MKEQDRNLEYFDDLDKLESLKQEYNNIPVPEAAKARIMSGIQKGKTMNKKHNPFFRIFAPPAGLSWHWHWLAYGGDNGQSYYSSGSSSAGGA